MDFEGFLRILKAESSNSLDAFDSRLQNPSPDSRPNPPASPPPPALSTVKEEA